MHSFLLAGLAGSLIVAAFGALPAAAQTTAQPADGRSAVPVAPQNPTRPLRGGASQVAANGAPIVLEVNKGTLIRLSAPAATVFIANPDIADVQVKSPSLIYISAKAPGETVIYAVDATDSVLLNSPVRVEHDVSRLRSSLRQLAPGEQISADSVDGNLVLSGVVSDAGKADKVQRARRLDRRRGQGLARHQPDDGRHPEPGQSAGADRRSERYEIERDRRQLAEDRLDDKVLRPPTR